MRIRDEKLIKEIKQNDIIMGRAVAETIDSEKDKVKIFFEEKDFQEMGAAKDLVLDRVLNDKTIRMNLNKIIRAHH